MITIKDSIEINRTPQHVYSYVVDLENVPRWQPAVIEVKRLTEGPTRVGSQFREVARMMGRKISTTCVIKQLDPGKTIAFGATSDGPLEYDTTYTLEATPTGTRLNINGSFRTKGMWRLLEPIIRASVRRESRGELATMKQVIESRY
jgi:uncharacterized protein YndB with AHSA1/START domain